MQILAGCSQDLTLTLHHLSKLPSRSKQTFTLLSHPTFSHTTLPIPPRSPLAPPHQKRRGFGIAQTLGRSPTSVIKRLHSEAALLERDGGENSAPDPLEPGKKLQQQHRRPRPDPPTPVAYRASSGGGRRWRWGGGWCAAPGKRPPRRSLRGGWEAPAPAPAAPPATPAARSAARHRRKPVGAGRVPWLEAERQHTSQRSLAPAL